MKRFVAIVAASGALVGAGAAVAPVAFADASAALADGPGVVCSAPQSGNSNPALSFPGAPAHSFPLTGVYPGKSSGSNAPLVIACGPGQR
jgi:hypothetical protein